MSTHDRLVLPERGAASLLGFLWTFAASVLSWSRFRFTALLCEPSLLLPDLLLPDLALTAIVLARQRRSKKNLAAWVLLVVPGKKFNIWGYRELAES